MKCFKLVFTWASSPRDTTWAARYSVLGANNCRSLTIYLFEVLMVDVSVDSEEPLENELGDGEEVPGEGSADLAGEHRLVLHLE